MTAETTSARGPETLDRVVIRFAGDSGDGMQLAGDRFTDVSAAFGNDLATLPNFPAEIRAPAGTIAGVSSFQVHISDHDILTPGDSPNVLVAMNPAALKANLQDMPPGSTLLLNEDSFEQRNLDKAGYQANPIEDGSLSAYRIVQVPMTSITLESTKDLGVKPRDAERSKNFFALGLLSWMYTRPIDPIVEWINERFGSKATVRDANLAAFKAGYHFGETAELFDHPWEVLPADLPAGRYRNITGNVALAYGLIAASQSSKLPIAYASYPITPASDILHELSRHKNFGVRTMQAEDEIGAAGVAVGAAFAGHLGITATSGPGMDLKAESMGLAVSLELPLIVVDVQRGGPSTGLPTKTEQSDLLLAMYGRHGEAPMPVVAPRSPSHCFEAAFEATRIALEVPDAGHPAHRRVSRQRLGALVLARRRGAARHRRAVRGFAQPRRRLLALPARARDAGAAVGHSGHAGPDAPHRRPREGRRHRQRQLRPREPRAHDAHPRREGGAHRVRHLAGRGRRPGRRRAARARMGEHVGLDPGRGSARARRRQAGRPRAPRAHEPVPREPR